MFIVYHVVYDLGIIETNTLVHIVCWNPYMRHYKVIFYNCLEWMEFLLTGCDYSSSTHVCGMTLWEEPLTKSLFLAVVFNYLIVCKYHSIVAHCLFNVSFLLRHTVDSAD